jgi:hypothetical protein
MQVNMAQPRQLASLQAEKVSISWEAGAVNNGKDG